MDSPTPNLADAGSSGPGNCSGCLRKEHGDPRSRTVFATKGGSVCHAHLWGLCPHTPGVYEAWGKSWGYCFGVRESKDSLWRHIRRHPIRLSLGRLLSSIARFRFTGPLRSIRVFGLSQLISYDCHLPISLNIQGGNFKTASKGVDRFQYPFVHHGDTEGTEKILEFLWNFSASFVPPW